MIEATLHLSTFARKFGPIVMKRHDKFTCVELQDQDGETVLCLFIDSHEQATYLACDFANIINKTVVTKDRRTVEA
jgi:hypothetical protein